MYIMSFVVKKRFGLIQTEQIRLATCNINIGKAEIWRQKMHKLNYLYSLYVYVCLSTRQNSLFFRSSIKFNKILCLCVCVCLPPSTIPLSRLPSGQNVTAPNVTFLTVLSFHLLCFYILKLELFQ